MAEIYFIRHGETLWNKERRYQGQSDVALSRRGRDQVLRIKPFFEELKPKFCFASDLLRAKESAELLFGGEIFLDKELREINLGSLEGTLYSSFDFYTHDEHEPIFGGETISEAKERIVSFTERIAAVDDKIAVVTHGALILLLLSHIANKKPSEMKLEISNCSVTKIVALPVHNDFNQRFSISYIGKRYV